MMTKKIRSTFIHYTKRIFKAFYTFGLLFCILLITQCQRTSKSGQTNEGLNKATTFAYYPSLRNLEIRIGELGPEIITGPQKVLARVRLQGKNKTVARQKFLVSEKGGNYLMKLPALKDGTYELTVSMNGGASEVKKIFKHKNYPWLGNDLGKKDMIYTPFEPIKVNDNVAQVVLRDYQMNGFGLWNSVKSQGKEILAAPIVLHLTTDKGEESWQFAEGKWSSVKDIAVTYKAEAESGPVRVKSTSTIEYDGCMKVEMELLPGKSAESIQHLWLEIPMKDSEVPLFHYTAFESMRRNYAGETPRGGKITWVNEPHDTDPPRWPQGALPPYWKAEQGSDDGILWTCRDIRPWKHVISTDFVPYIWLGGGERGLAFFGANDKGYLVDRQGTMQTIERRGNILYLRIDIVNKPSVIKETRHITFGLQASPTRPMPAGWRTNPNVPPPHGGPVVCWGGYFCADKYPDGHNFAIVDEIVKARQTGQVDMAVFEKFDRERATPWRFMWSENNEPWLGGTLRFFIGINRGAHDNPKALLESYQEEHASDITYEEWEIYQDEWRAGWPWPERTVVVEKMKPDNNFDSGRQAYPPSYLDFCLYYDNEYMKRGVGLYFDNTMPYTCWNPLISEAYNDENGKLQPSCTIWEQRTYYKRVWTLMNELMTKGIPPFPLAFTQHVTNTCVLPLNTWNNASLDIEWRWYDEEKYIWGDTPNPIPFPAGLLLTEASGRQTGSYPYSHFGVNSHCSAWGRQPETTRNEWGMRIVHEILRGKPSNPLWRKFENALRDFGYGSDDCTVINYWSDDPPVSINDEKTKWIVVSRKKDNSLFLVLQTWNKVNTEVRVKLDAARLGFTPALKVRDVEKDMVLPITSVTDFKVMLTGPYGTKVLKIGSD